MGNAQILSLLEKIPEKRVNSRKFNEVFQIDGIPLWYFLERFIRSQYLPKPFKPRWGVEKDIKNNRFPSLLDKLKFNLSAFAVRKGLVVNEKIKFLITKSGEKDLGGIRKKDVLFIATTDQIFEKNGKLEFLELGRIITSLKRSKKVKPLVLVCDPVSKNSFFRLNRYGRLLYEHITPEILKESKRLSRDLHNKWKTLDEKSKIRLFTYRGESYWKFFENNMDFLFSRELLFTLIKYYLAFKEILKKHDIKVIYLTGLVGFYELSALGAVYKLNRRVVFSSHGRLGIPEEKGAGKWKFMKTVFFATSGRGAKRKFLEWGVKKENIVITGSPFLDEIVDYKRKRAPKAKKTVGLITTALIEGRFMGKEEYFKLIRETLAQIKNAKEIEKIVIRLHPREKYRSEYESIVKSLNMKNVEIIQKPTRASLYSVIADSDLLLGFISTAVLEGLMLDKDVIHLDAFSKTTETGFRKVTLCAKKGDNLTELIKRVLSDENLRKKLRKKRERYLRESFYKLDGKAHERVADLIERIVLKNG